MIARILFVFLLLGAMPASAAPLAVRAVVVTTFQHGEDGPGEMRAWMAGAPRKLPFAASDLPLRYDPVRHLLVVSTGMGSVRAAAVITALGTDPRFDLTHAYWLVAGIAGIDPKAGGIGSAAWIGDVVDGDYGFEIDPREAPKSWTTGKLPWFRPTPYALPVPDKDDNLFTLNHALRDWAFARTRAIALPDDETLQKARGDYRGNAATPPAVLKGSEISGQSWWAGRLANAHARRWVDYWTEGGEPMVMSAMEDSGIVRAVRTLGRLGRADPGRLMILRTASDYTAPPPGQSAAAYVAAIQAKVPATRQALDAAWRIGAPVVDEITGHWTRYRDRIPGR